jgi:hypothetical protein
LTSEICDRLPAGVYLARAMRDALCGLTGDPASGTSGGALLAQRAEGLASRALSTHMSAVSSRAPALVTAAQEDMKKVKTCLAVLFMHAACALPADAAGQEALQALAAPLGWSESCEYDEDRKAMELLINVRHAHGEEALTVLDADQVVALYRSIMTRGSGGCQWTRLMSALSRVLLVSRCGSGIGGRQHFKIICYCIFRMINRKMYCN